MGFLLSDPGCCVHTCREVYSDVHNVKDGSVLFAYLGLWCFDICWSWRVVELPRRCFGLPVTVVFSYFFASKSRVLDGAPKIICCDDGNINMLQIRFTTPKSYQMPSLVWGPGHLCKTRVPTRIRLPSVAPGAAGGEARPEGGSVQPPRGISGHPRAVVLRHVSDNGPVHEGPGGCLRGAGLFHDGPAAGTIFLLCPCVFS